VRQPGQSAFGEFQHPALREYHPTLLAATVRTPGMTWKKDPSRWPWYRIPLSPSTAPDTGGSPIVGRSGAELAMAALFRC